jgi:hypothetical protein
MRSDAFYSSASYLWEASDKGPRLALDNDLEVIPLRSITIQ